MKKYSVISALSLTAICATLAPTWVHAATASTRHASCRISIDQGQAGFFVTAGFGGGHLTCRGKTYPFKISGLGLGGIGVSRIRATGTVYDLKSLKLFPGAYVATARMAS